MAIPVISQLRKDGLHHKNQVPRLGNIRYELR